MDWLAWRRFVDEVRREEEQHRRTNIGPSYPSLSIGVSDRLTYRLYGRVEALEQKLVDLETAAPLNIKEAAPASRTKERT